ncbi:hypothetical protein GCM10028807_17750 [Spirosoma daeguense]
MTTTINQRINQLIQALNMKSSAFADSIEKTPTAIYTILNGRNKPGYDILESILSRYPKINATWLITGEGEMFREESTPVTSPDNYLHDHLKALEDNFERLTKQLENKDRQIEGLQRTVDSLLSRPGATANFLNDVADHQAVVRIHPATQAVGNVA